MPRKATAPVVSAEGQIISNEKDVFLAKDLEKAVKKFHDSVKKIGLKHDVELTTHIHFERFSPDSIAVAEQITESQETVNAIERPSTLL